MNKAHGLAHVTLTVSNISQTKKFYETLFEAKLPMDDQKSFSLLTVDIPCWFVQWEKQHPGDRFDETRIGLDHIAFHHVAFRDPDNIQTEFFIPKEL